MANTQRVWEVPEPRAILAVEMNDGTIIYLRRHGNPKGPRMVLSHGNGLASDLYYPFWSLLVDDFDLILYDLRNHGWNPVGSQMDHHLPSFVDDQHRILETIDREFGAKPKIGIFHSISALTTLLSDTRGSEFAACILFDPPVCKANEIPEEFDEATRRCAQMTLNRTDQFDSIEECVDILRYLPPFSRVVSGVHELYAKTTLRQSANDGTYALRCPREYEAQIISYAKIFIVFVDLDSLQCPMKVLGADPVLPYSFLPSFNLSHISTLDYDFLPNATHFLQLEQPHECVAVVREFLEHHNLLDP